METRKCSRCEVSTHSRLKAAGESKVKIGLSVLVSTHSRLKAAGAVYRSVGSVGISFNTQPPEGGWSSPSASSRIPRRFQHTAA